MVERTRRNSDGRAVLAAVLALGVIAAGAGCTLPIGTAESLRLRELLAIEPGMVVADVGAGKGGWTLEMSRAVGPNGHVYSTEIDPKRIGEIRAAVSDAGVDNVSVIEGTPQDTGLPEGCCDAIFLRHVHHHITHPEAMHASLRQALRPGGRLAIIDFEPFLRLLGIPEGVPENRAGHGMPLEVLLDELASAGFELEHRIDDWFRFDYCAVWTRPDMAPSTRGVRR
ncbi:MAG: class I SAM-dependent methyltransferase [Myxococcota bacterium]